MSEVIESNVSKEFIEKRLYLTYFLCTGLKTCMLLNMCTYIYYILLLSRFIDKQVSNY